MGLFEPPPSGAPRACARCGTQLSPFALACPVCAALVHRVRLQELADLATTASASGERDTARQHWESALALVPPESDQHRLIRERLTALAEPASGTPASGAAGPEVSTSMSGWKKAAGAVVTVGLLLIGKLKFLLLGLTKASTFISMFGFLAVYWSLYGWPLALGLVVAIYIHEMGHVSELRRLGIHAGAPLFIPGMGAVVMLKERITDPIVDARIGLAGPLWGMGAAIGAWLVAAAIGSPLWHAIAGLAGLLNLFNLMPVWQLDGSRGFNALSRADRWVAVGAIALMLFLTGQRMLWLVGAVAVWRSFKRDAGPGHTRTLATYVALVVVLSLLARDVR